MSSRQDILSLKDLNPPLIIDFGSDNFKYCQPIMNTSLMAKEMIENQKNEIKFMRVQGTENEIKEFKNNSSSISKLSTNTIYDINFAKKINLVDPKGLYNGKEFTYKDTVGVQDTVNKYNFEFEPIYQGKINNQKTFESILEEFKKKYDPYVLKIKNRDEFFKDTPIIILQDCYPLKELYKQVSKIYKFFFEEFQSPYVLVQSKPSLDIFAHNLDTGIVIDFGDSKTSFTPVVNGFADFKNTKFNTFLSGRTITNFVNQIKFEGNNYIEAKNIKEKFCFLEDDVTASLTENHEHKYCFLNYLYVYPELFKSHFRKPTFCGKALKFHNYSFENIKNLVQRRFTYSNEEARIELARKIDEFKSDMDTLYKNTTNESGFKLKEYEANLLNIKLMEFKQYSLAHLILMNISKLHALKSPVIGKDTIDIVLTGGVLNNNYMIDTIKEEIKEIDNRYKNFKFHTFENNDKCFDQCFGFAKGANYLCNIDNLQSLMVSKKDFDEQGVYNLGYNYI